MSKTYHLDNPRDNFIYYSEIYQDNKDNEKTEKKDFFGLKILKKVFKEPMFVKKNK